MEGVFILETKSFKSTIFAGLTCRKMTNFFPGTVALYQKITPKFDYANTTQQMLNPLY
jgi:hypothetical protein